MSSLTLKIVTPSAKPCVIDCDSVNVTVCDNKDGKGGGSYGIHKGHIRSVMSLDKGVIRADRDGETVYFAKSGVGFCTVDKDTVIAVVESAEI